MEERRYTDAEVRKIIEIATTQGLPQPRALPADGLTLSDVQSVGSEVGIDTTAIAHAAAALDAGVARPARRTLGIPIEVGRVVPLPRAPTDQEWETLVSELRATFGAQGRISVQGNLREWRNGNLHASVEPGPSGYRLRLGTYKGDAHSLNALGATGIAAGAAVFAGMIVSGELVGAIVVPAIFGTAGLTAFLANMLRLPRWADRRSTQMDHMAARAGAIISDAHEGSARLPSL